MAIFKDERFDYLEEERKKLWAQLTAIEGQLHAIHEETRFLKEKSLLLEEELSKKTTDYETEAKEASKKAVEHATSSKSAIDAINTYLNEANTKLEEIRTVSQFASTKQPEINGYYTSSQTVEQNIKKILADIEGLHKTVTGKVDELNTYYSNHGTYVEKVTKLEDLYTKGNDFSTKIEQFYKSILGKNDQINKLHLSIEGYTDKDDKGNEVRIPGLKDTLESEYTALESQADNLSKKIADIELNSESQYNTYRQSKEDEFNATLMGWKTEYLAISKRIEDLLPNALTAGLSAAYSAKKDAEIKESKSLSDKFLYAICGLIAVSLIPFGISIIKLTKSIPIEKILLEMPNYVPVILPLYIPVLWLAYSANRRMNLSKRLIEEYTHKEVLSKTFEGLSRQIENIENKKISADLRIKLLYNILEVNSENPGKLITDYNKSDHPLMDALEKSVKLGNAVDKLAEIPGLRKLASVLDKKAERIKKKNKEKADEGLEVLEEEGEGT